jgi:hypothetical protein
MSDPFIIALEEPHLHHPHQVTGERIHERVVDRGALAHAACSLAFSCFHGSRHPR